MKDAQKQLDQLTQQALQLYGRGQQARAIVLATQATEVALHHFGEDHPAFADSLERLAGLYSMMGNYAQAAPLLQRVLVIRRRVLGDDHPE